MAASALRGTHCRGLIEINKTGLQFSYLGSRGLEGTRSEGKVGGGCSETLDLSELQKGGHSLLPHSNVTLT